MVSAERLRLDQADTGREDYGRGDNTWSYFSHEQARSRAYRWGDGRPVSVVTGSSCAWHWASISTPRPPRRT